MVSMWFWEAGQLGKVFTVILKDLWKEVGGLGPWQPFCLPEKELETNRGTPPFKKNSGQFELGFILQY